MIRRAKEFGKALLDVFPGLRVKAKQSLAELLVEDEGRSGPRKKSDEVIIDQRNAHVIQVLQRQLRGRRSGRVAIFYGAGHHADLAARLRKLGWQQRSKRWQAAWRFGALAPEGPAQTPRPARPEVYDF